MVAKNTLRMYEGRLGFEQMSGTYRFHVRTYLSELSSNYEQEVLTPLI